VERPIGSKIRDVAIDARLDFLAEVFGIQRHRGASRTQRPAQHSSRGHPTTASEDLMHAVLVHVTIAPNQFEAARKSLAETVVPRVKQAPGLVKGYWTSSDDGTTGVSLIVFRTEQDANNALTMVRNSPPPAGVTLSSVEVREVVAEA
jgi:hypothetical protein